MTSPEPSRRPTPIPTVARYFLLFLSEICLVLGGLFFVNPDPSIPLWPWPVKSLAVRFIGAIFLAIAFGCWTALRSQQWQRSKILLLVGGTFFGVGFFTALNQLLSNTTPWFIWLWIIFFLSAMSGCFNLLRAYGWTKKYGDSQGTIPSTPLLARVFFIIQTLIVGAFGSIMLVSPDTAQQQFWPWHVAVPTLQLFAGLFLATCLATAWASVQKDVRRIRVLLPLDIAFPSLALLAVGIHWGTIELESPSVLVTGVWIFVYSFVAVGSTIIFLTAKPKLN